jgi:hypothetical protein
VEATAKGILRTELQRERNRVFCAAAERAAIKNKLAVMRKRNRLLVVQMKGRTHQQICQIDILM